MSERTRLHYPTVYVVHTEDKNRYKSVPDYTVYVGETKVAAARDHVENGLTKTEAMARHGIASIASLERWCRDYRSGGAQAEARTDARAGARRTGRVPEGEGRVPGKLRALRASKSRGASEAPSSDCSQGGDTGSTTS